MAHDFIPHSGHVITIARLNLRSGSPFTTAGVAMTAARGQVLNVTGIGRGQMVSGNDTWYAGEGQVYFWSGGCSDFRPGAAPAGTGPVPVPAPNPAMQVNRRPDGTIRALDNEGLARGYGRFDYTSISNGRITILGNWVDENIVTIDTPLLDRTGFRRIQVHRKAADPFRRVLAAIEAQGLGDVILTCAGTFVPRHINWNPAKPISSHAWGVAIDFNAAWNGYGVTPPALGAHGSVRALIALFEAEGFAWGGYFGTPDGMHFELARSDL